ncbi:MAG: hypothetical protein ABL996_10045 [Micropepsaceae bacterium]
MRRVAIEFGSLNEATIHEAMSAIADLAEEAHGALNAAFEVAT